MKIDISVKIGMALLDGPLTRKELRDRLWAEACNHIDNEEDEKRHRRTALQVLSRQINIHLSWQLRMRAGQYQEVVENDGRLHLTAFGAKFLDSPEFRFLMRQGAKLAGFKPTH